LFKFSATQLGIFKLKTDTITICDRISDIDECRDDNGGCQHICENKLGNYVCLCLPGYDINNDSKTCTGNVHAYCAI